MSLAHSVCTAQSLLHPTVSLPREHLAAIQHIINDALAIQARGQITPPPPYNNMRRNDQPSWYKPRMDMYLSPSASGSRPIVIAKFELPGLRREDIHIDVLNNHMIVAGDRRELPECGVTGDEMAADEASKPEMNGDTGKAEEGEITMANAEDRAGYTVREIKRGRFRRIVPLPAGTKLDDVKAKMDDGILTITFPGLERPVVHSITID
ncbi:HSP20-like chaperone [Ramaria rubella]|nr:HSP20-like chaperone [Ramaria rubella]